MMKMPHFLVIGVGKSGTTSLYIYLKEHPQIFMSTVKEPNFFQFGEFEQPPPLDGAPYPYAIQTLPAYQALFADAPANALRGEASPSSFEARACERINHYVPNAKLICILRQPIDRAYSAYAMHFRRGSEADPDFFRAYQAQRNENRHTTKHLYACRDANWYLTRLKDWLSRYPRQQLHIGLYDDLKADSVGYMRAIYAFLEVDTSFIPNATHIHNQGAGVRIKSLPRLMRQHAQWLRWIVPQPLRQRIVRGVRDLNQAPLPPLDPQLRRDLTLPQNDDILRLQDLIGRDLTHWLAE